MYNRIIYNRAPYNAVLATVWTATGEAITESTAALIRRQFLAGNAETVSESNGIVIRRQFVIGTAADSTSEGVGIVIRRQFLSGEAAEAITISIAVLEKYLKDELTIEDLAMTATDVLIIDTDTMNVWLNDVLIMESVADDAVFFNLFNGSNNIVIAGSGAADIEIQQKERWL